MTRIAIYLSVLLTKRNPKLVSAQGATATPASIKPDSRCRKNPSSYPDFNARPFCTTTLSRPRKPSDFNNCCMDAESTSAARTLRRRSTKLFSSLQLSTLLIGNRPWGIRVVMRYGDRIAPNFRSQGSLYQDGVEIYFQLAWCYTPHAILQL